MSRSRRNVGVIQVLLGHDELNTTAPTETGQAAGPPTRRSKRRVAGRGQGEQLALLWLQGA